MEHTGLYNRLLVGFLLQQKAKVWLESSLVIKRSLGLNRGKNDKVDSFRIADYSLRFTDKCLLTDDSYINFNEVKDLLANRERLVKQLKSAKVAIKEMEKMNPKHAALFVQANDAAIKGLKESLRQIDKLIDSYVLQNEEINQLFCLITSINGVGRILALNLIVYTHGFKRLQNSRQLACYCGIAPFEHSSGTSIKGRVRISKFANMNLKRILHLAAISSIQHNKELKAYYNRKVEEGKSKMSVINAVRNKLIHRVIAVINRGTPYVQLNTVGNA
jgi:transposase